LRRFGGIGVSRLGLLSGGLVLAIAGAGYAMIPDSGRVYTACMLKNVGTIRLIDPSLPKANLMSHCSALESPITWNQQGTAGAPGMPGTKGSVGPTGAVGPQGPKGDVGAAGADGATGAVGPQGPEGDPGADGAQGAKGETGPAGSGIGAGSVCKTHDGRDGTFTSSVNADDDLVLHCVSTTPPPPPPPSLESVNIVGSDSLPAGGDFIVGGNVFLRRTVLEDTVVTVTSSDAGAVLVRDAVVPAGSDRAPFYVEVLRSSQTVQLTFRLGTSVVTASLQTKSGFPF
jgi:hypothetical protein